MIRNTLEILFSSKFGWNEKASKQKAAQKCRTRYRDAKVDIDAVRYESRGQCAQALLERP